MAESSGLIYARIADTTHTGTGPSAALQWLDRAGNPTSVVPPAGESFVAFLHGEVVNEAGNDQWGELRFAFGGTTIQRARSSFRFTTINGNDASGGQCPGLAFITGDGTSELTAHLLGEAVGSQTDCTGVEAVLANKASLRDYHEQETTNGDALLVTPADGSGWLDVEAYEFTPDTTTTGPSDRYLLSVVVELAGNGSEAANTEPTRAEYSGRVRISTNDGVDWTTFQQGFEMDVAIGYAAGETMHSARWSIPIDATAGQTIDVAVQVNGSLGLGTIGARRIRICSFRGPNIYSAVSSAGINANNAAAATASLPGAVVSVADIGESVLCTMLATFESQAATFGYGQFDIDSGASYQPAQGFFRGISNSGVAAADDLTQVTAQYSEALAIGAHTVGMRATWVASGQITWGRDRGNTTHVPQTIVVVQWVEPAAEGGEEVEGEFAGTLPVLGMLATGDVETPEAPEVTGTLEASLPMLTMSAEGEVASVIEGEFAALLPGLAMLATASVQTDNPLGYLSEVFDYDDDPRNRGWSLLNLVSGNTPTQCSVHDGELHLEPTAGGAGGSFWFNLNDGILLWKEISGWHWQITAAMRALNSAGTGLPPVTNFRMTVLQVQDPADWPAAPSASDAARQSTYNYVHGGFGSFGVADLRAEWKTNDDGVTTTGSVSWPSAEGYVRIVRRYQTFIVQVSADGVSWTTIQTFDRSATPMPYTCRWGFGAYASVTTHDIQLRVASVTVESLAGAFEADLPLLELVAAGDVEAPPNEVEGEFAASVPALALEAVGSVEVPPEEVDGDFVGALPLLALVATGDVEAPPPDEVEGEFAASLPGLLLEAVGDVVAPPEDGVVGTFGTSLPALTMAAEGLVEAPPPEEVDGDFAGALPLLELVADGSVVTVIVGDFAGTLPALRMSAATGDIGFATEIARVVPTAYLEADTIPAAVAEAEASEALPAIDFALVGEDGSEVEAFGLIAAELRLVHQSTGEVVVLELDHEGGRFSHPGGDVLATGIWLGQLRVTWADGSEDVVPTSAPWIMARVFRPSW